MISRKAIYYAGLCLLAIVAVLWTLNTANTVLSYIPFTSQWHDRRELAKVPGLEANVSKLTREATGNAEIGRAVETYHTREVIYRDLQTQAEIEARTAPDADTPLPAERLARHLRNDERVCANATFTCAPLDAPLGGSGAVPPDDASR